MKKIILSLIVVMLAACSSTPPTTNKLIQSDRHYFQYQTGVEAKFTRDSGFVGGGCSHDISVNGVKLFSIRQGETIKTRLPAEFSLIQLDTGGGICPNITITIESDIKENSTPEYRILMPSDGTLRMVRLK